MKRVLSLLFTIILTLTLTAGLASCGKDVEFNVNFVVDGEIYATVGTSGEETIRIPENPTKDGYAFDGWYWDNGVWQKQFTANSMLDAPLSSDMSVYAKWNCVHTASDWITDNDATCKEAGSKHKECTKCEEVLETATIDKHSNHTPAEAKIENFVDSTCKVEGSYDEVVYCSVCEIEISRTNKTVEKKTTHTPAEAEIENFVDSTCKVEGSYDEVVYCSVCGIEISRNNKIVGKKTTHTPGETKIENTVAPDCVNKGFYDSVVYCSVCKVEVSRETVTVYANGHSHNSVVTAPTCTEKGYTTHTCHCGDAYIDTYVDELGHSYNNGVITTAPTCTEKGVKTFTCSTCGDSYTEEVAALGHTEGGAVIENNVDPDCVNDGSYDNVVYCTVCEAELSRNTVTVDALGHKDENTDGYCDACDVIVNAKLAISGTYYSIYREKIVVDTEYFKLDDEEYIVVFTYDISGDVFTAAYHSVICEDAELKELLEGYYEGAVFSYGFAFTKETISLIDEDLDAEVYYRPEFLPPCEHDVITIEGKAPTCTEEGYTDFVYCDICGEVFTELESIEKIDHTYDQTVASDDYLKSEATVDSPAIYYKSCICGAKGEETFTHGDVLTIPLLSVTLNKTETTLAIGATETLIATLNPSNTTEKIKWVSSDESVVKVVNGTLIAVGRGNAIVTVETEDYIFAYCTVKVIIPVENVTLDKSEAEIYVGQPFALNAIVLPENADGKTLTWTSSDELVATVNANGVITAKSAGTVVITATAPNGVSASCTLTVKAGELKFTATEDSSFYYVSGYEGYETHIEIPNMHDGLRVIRVAESAFKGNTIIESITLPNSIQTIDAHAFEGCTSLKTITIPDSVTVISAYTFADCTALTSVLLNKNLTSIGEYAFKGCTALTDISIKAAGAKLATIGSYAFANCTALKSFNISEYASVLETVGDHAFSRCTALESVILSNSVKTISTSAFEYCSTLTSIDLGESLVTIADKAFDYCISLAKIEMPDTVTTLGNMAFRHNDELSEVIFSSSLVKIGNAAFQYCISIEELVLPENITQLGNSAFSYCEGIKYLGILGNITVWGDSTFYECGNIEVIYIASKTNSEIPENNYIFYNVGAKSEGIALALGINAIIPEGLFEPVEDIENYPKIAGIMAEDGSVSFNAFAEKNNLPYLIAISMPNSMESLTYGIFNNSPWWEAQEKGVVYIDNYFYGYKCECHAATPTEIWVENYLAPTCTEEGFYQNVCKCSVCEYEVLRQDVIIPELGHAPLDAVVENYVAPDCITDGSYDSVVYCGRCGEELLREGNVVPALDHDYIDHEAKTVTCTEIGWDAYQTCGRCDYTTYVEIPALDHDYIDHEAQDPTCTNVGWHEHQTCGRCDYTTRVDIEAIGHDYIDYEAKSPDCINVGWHAYQTCSRCEYTSYAELSPRSNLHSTNNGYCTICYIPESTPGLEYTINSDGESYMVSGIGTCTENNIVIGIYNNCSVTYISNCAFESCDKISSVIIGDCVTGVFGWAFSDCRNLTHVEIGNNVTVISLRVFSNNKRLESVIIGNGVVSIENYAFGGCTALSSVTIPESVTSISSGAFDDSNLTSIIVDENNLNFKSIDGNLYSNDGKTLLRYAPGKTATNYIIPNGVIDIGEYAFDGCKNLLSIAIPNSVTSVGKYAFFNCTQLKSVIMGNGIMRIGEGALCGCTSLTSIKYRGTQTQWAAVSKGDHWNYDTGSYKITYNYKDE